MSNFMTPHITYNFCKRHFCAINILADVPYETFRHAEIFGKRYFSVLDIPSQACYSTGIFQQKGISWNSLGLEYSFINDFTQLLRDTNPLGLQGKKFVCPSYHLSKLDCEVVLIGTFRTL